MKTEEFSKVYEGLTEKQQEYIYEKVEFLHGYNRFEENQLYPCERAVSQPYCKLQKG